MIKTTHNFLFNLYFPFYLSEATLLEATKFDTPSTPIFTSLLSKSTLKSKTPKSMIRAAITPIHHVANSNQNSPEIHDPRVSLNKEFEAATARPTTPLLPQRGNTNERAITSENTRSASLKPVLLTPSRGQGERSSTTPMRDMYGSVTGNATPAGGKKFTTNVKTAWMELPSRTESSTSIVGSSSGELSISAFLTASNTPKVRKCLI